MDAAIGKPKYFIAVGVVFLLVLLSSCNSSGTGDDSKKDMQTQSSPTSPHSGGPDDSPGGNDGGNINGGGEDDDDGGFISVFKPALAVRATGCIMCHGRVEANMITDFGFGNSYFFGRNVSGLSEFSGSIYGDHAENWATGKVWGKIFVPNAPVTLPGRSETNLRDYLQAVVPAPDASTLPPEVKAQGTVFIGTPTATRILAVAGSISGLWKFISSVQSNFDSLEVAPGGNYIRNRPNQIFQCEGDLIVNGVLFLNDLQLSTGNTGCRIYATKTVFVQGAITYLGTAPYRNLQIMSSRAVLMGLGPGPIDVFGNIVSQNSVEWRLQSMWTAPGFATREPGTTAQKLNLIVQESHLVTELVDADSQPSGRGVAFERLLINTPNYESRYQGEFKGTIIAELALASLNNFAFKFDDVFSHVKVFPLVQESELLQIVP